MGGTGWEKGKPERTWGDIGEKTVSSTIDLILASLSEGDCRQGKSFSSGVEISQYSNISFVDLMKVADESRSGRNRVFGESKLVFAFSQCKTIGDEAACRVQN